MKSTAEADKYRKIGNEFFQKKEHQPALDAYGKSLLHAPVSSESQAYALGNRSAVLYEIGSHPECLRDIERALALAACPKSLAEKLLRRKSNCSPNSTVIEGRMSLLSKYYQGIIPELCKGPNENIPSLSQKVKMDYRPECGRRLVAAEDIEAGSVLIVERPYASILLEHTLTTHCHNCHEILPLDFIPCVDCAEVRFCSESCYEVQRSAHELECGEVGRLMQGGLASLAYKIFLTTSIEDLSGYFSCPHRLLQQCKLQEGVYGIGQGQLYDNGFDCVINLMAHHEKVKREELAVFEQSIQSLTRLATSRKRWPGIVDDLFRLSFNVCESCRAASKPRQQELATSFLLSLFLRLIEMLICNAHAICSIVRQYEPSGSVTEDPIEKVGELKIASAIYSTASLMNHSCKPNIFSSFIGKTQIVRASRAISAGEEILNCYGPQFGRMLTAARKMALRQQYYFDCTCVCCTHPEYAKQEACFTALKCPECQKTCNDEAKNFLNEWADTPAMLKDTSKGEYVCTECNFRKRDEEVAEELEERCRKLDAALERTEEDTVMDLSSVQADVLKCFKSLDTYLYAHNKQLSEWRDKVAPWLLKHGSPEETLSLLETNLTTVEFIYGCGSLELCNEVVKFFDVLSAASLMGCNYVDKSSTRSYLRRLEQAEMIFQIHYGPECIQIQELREMRALIPS